MRAGRLLFFIALCCAPLAMLHAATAGSTPTHQHIANGSFESGTAHWSIFGASMDAVATHALGIPDGVRAAHIIAPGGDFSLRGGGPLLSPPGVYTVSFHIQSEHDVSLYVETPYTTAAITDTAYAGGWARITAQIASPAAFAPAITIRGVTAPGATVYIDDVRLEGGAPVTATPTPSVIPPDAVAAADSTQQAPTPIPTPTPFVDVISGSIRNASFEDVDAGGLPHSWQKFGGALVTTTGVVRAGQRAARFESNTDSLKWVHQVIAITPGETYEFSGWIDHNQPGVSSAFSRLSWYASDTGEGGALRTNDSTERLDAPAPGYRWLTTGPVTAPPNARSVRVRVMLAPRSAAPAFIHIDDLAFSTAIPLPTEEPGAEEAAPAAVATARRVATSGGAATRSNRSSSAHSSASGAVVYDTGPYDARVVINEVLYDAVAEGTDSDNEWVEIYNAGPGAVSLGGWALADGRSADILPDVVLEARTLVVVAASDSFFAAHPEFGGRAIVLGGRIGNGLGNDGNRLSLIDASGYVVDAISWGDDASILNPAIPDVPAGHSIERSWPGRDANHANDWTDNESPSPGRAMDVSDAYTERKLAGGSVQILESPAAGRFGWLPWTLAGVSAFALVATASWRALSAVRDRSHPA